MAANSLTLVPSYRSTKAVSYLLLTAVFSVPAISFAACPANTNGVTFLGTDTTTQGAWKGAGNFNAPPASSSLTYGRDGDILPDTESCDLGCNPFPSYVSFGPQCINSSTPGNTGSKPNSTHAYVNMVQGPASVMGAEPQNSTNTNYFQCNYSDNNPSIPWAPMVAWRPVVDTRQITKWYTCGIPSYYLELSFGASTHNFEVYVVDDMNGGTLARSEELQVLDGDTGAVLWDSGVFTNFSGGVYYKWALTGHVKIKVINAATNGRDAVINGVFFDPLNAAPLPVSISVAPGISSLVGGASEQMIASVSNTGNTAVTWSISPAVGSISTGGVYAAPTSVTSAQTVTVTATSVADPSKSASARLTLMPPVTSVNGSPLVVSTALGSIRNDYTGWVGFGFRVGSAPLTVSGLGRIAVAGNTQSHSVKLVDAATGADVPGGSALVIPGAAPAGTFAYGALGSPVTLAGSKTYYVLTQETSGGDQWYDKNTSVQTTADATGTGPIYGTGSWTAPGPTGNSYAPVDIKYSLNAPPPPPPPSPVSGTALVTSMTTGTVRNNYTGWVGSVLQVGSAPLLVSGLGRISVAGNAQGHTVKLVDAITGLDVPNGSVSVTPWNATPGTMAYAALPVAVTLNAFQSYYVVTQETLGGDQWYDYNTTLQTTADASLTSAVYGGPAWIRIGASGHSYGPVDVKYTLGSGAPPPPISVSLTPPNVSLTVNQTQQFTATVTNTSNMGVVWTISPSVGSISTSGFYTAPAAIATAQNVTVTATSAADSSKFATASVSLVPPSGSAPPTGTAFMTGMILGTVRNNYTGWVGYQFTVGVAPMTVSALGRIAVSGNSQNHVVKLIDAATGLDVPGGSTSVTPSAVTPGTVAYAALASPVTLPASKNYYIVTQETFGGDQWYDFNSTVFTTAAASVTSAVYCNSPCNAIGSAGHTYGPVDFQYATGPIGPSITQQPQSAIVAAGQTATFSVIAAGAGVTYQWQSMPLGAGSFTDIPGAMNSTFTTPATVSTDNGTQFRCVVSGAVTSNAATLTVLSGGPSTAFVTSTSLGGTHRNDFTGVVGFTIAVGNSPLTVTSVGRMVMAGNTLSHVVKFVDHTGADIPGGSATVNTAGGTPGTFAYATLSTPITLNANTTYYLVSQETSGGDRWFDYYTTTLQTTNAAAVNGPIWSSGNSYNFVFGYPGSSYVPVDFKYQ